MSVLRCYNRVLISPRERCCAWRVAMAFSIPSTILSRESYCVSGIGTCQTPLFHLRWMQLLGSEETVLPSAVVSVRRASSGEKPVSVKMLCASSIVTLLVSMAKLISRPISRASCALIETGRSIHSSTGGLCSDGVLFRRVETIPPVSSPKDLAGAISFRELVVRGNWAAPPWYKRSTE